MCFIRLSHLYKIFWQFHDRPHFLFLRTVYTLQNAELLKLCLLYVDSFDKKALADFLPRLDFYCDLFGAEFIYGGIVINTIRSENDGKLRLDG